ncbi:TPM domain-containing protein [Aquidulcibacter sp.]|uniref:TPM domain-containing protein n=1 Tax=Aquidulcibacter sp. TaxID=2052990 RepID=UPI0025C5EFBF|nr:TPM domain-containing protein [Aquidulcibacter sp.]
MTNPALLRPSPSLSSRFWLGALLALSLIATCWMASPAWAADPKFPVLTGRVVDDANIIPEETEGELIAQLEALEAKSSDQLVVVTVPSLQGFEIEEYGYKLGRAWQIGQGERLNNGVILLVAPNERKVRIEVGYGLEGILTDYYTSEIIRDTIVPAFKAGDMPGGIVAGTAAIEQILTTDPAELQARAARGLKAEAKDSGADLQLIVLILVLIFLFNVLPALLMRRTRFRRQSPWGSGPIILHDWDDDDRGGGGGFGGFGGGFGGGGGGGGFSGGGGSFGGGGASGSW